MINQIICIVSLAVVYAIQLSAHREERPMRLSIRSPPWRRAWNRLDWCFSFSFSFLSGYSIFSSSLLFILQASCCYRLLQAVYVGIPIPLPMPLPSTIVNITLSDNATPQPSCGRRLRLTTLSMRWRALSSLPLPAILSHLPVPLAMPLLFEGALATWRSAARK